MHVIISILIDNDDSNNRKKLLYIHYSTNYTEFIHISLAKLVERLEPWRNPGEIDPLQGTQTPLASRSLDRPGPGATAVPCRCPAPARRYVADSWRQEMNLFVFPIFFHFWLFPICFLFFFTLESFAFWCFICFPFLFFSSLKIIRISYWGEHKGTVKPLFKNPRS